MEPKEFKYMVKQIRQAEKAIGSVTYGPTKQDNLAFRRSIFVIKDVKFGDIFLEENIRIIRPAHGMTPKYYNQVSGKRAAAGISCGTLLRKEMIFDSEAN